MSLAVTEELGYQLGARNCIGGVDITPVIGSGVSFSRATT